MTPLRRLTNTAEHSISLNPSLSDDGRAVAFESTADLAGTGGGSTFHAVRADLSTEPARFLEIGRTRAVSPGLSGDGSSLAFASAEDLVGRNADRNSEIYFFNGTTLIQITQTSPANEASRMSDGNFQPSLSADGHFIAFSSNRNLVGLNADLNLEIFVFDTDANTFTQLTANTGNIGSTSPKVSADGSRIAFIEVGVVGTDSHNLKLYDKTTGNTRIIAESVMGLSLAYGRAISDDGERVVYSGNIATNQSQVFLYDVLENSSRQITELGVRATDVNLQATISGDGRRIAFATRRKVLATSDGGVDLYLCDLPAAQVTEVTNAPSSATGEVVSSLNHDGSLVAFSFPRVLSGAVDATETANNCEIYLASLAPRAASGPATVLNAAAKGNEPSIIRTIAPGSIATIIGNALAFKSEQAQISATGDFPLSVAGTTVSVGGQPARLLYVSPEEIIVVIPSNVHSGPTQLVVTNADGFQSKADTVISLAAPGLFTIDGEGRGEGVLLNADTNGPGPFDPSDGQLRLSIFSTGVHNAVHVSVNIAGRTFNVETIASSPTLPGLDEVHFSVPAELRGAGAVNLILSADGVESNTVTVALSGSSLRDIMINEFLADPPDGMAGDANHDGERNATADEFVELVNSTARDLELGGYQLLTRSGAGANDIVRHTFAEGTILSAGTALVVFGGGNPDPNNPAFGGSYVTKSATGSLSLTNSGGVITLRDASGSTVSFATYGNAGGLPADANQSQTRSPDIVGNFIPHKLAPGGEGSTFSPGTRSDGRPFLPAPAISLITVAPALQSLQVGHNLQFLAQAFDLNNQPLPDVIFSWKSTVASVLSIDEKGLAKAVGPGTAQVIALARSVQSAPSQITITQPTPSPSPTPNPTPTPSPTPSPSPGSSPTPSPTPSASPSPSPSPGLFVLISEFRTRGPNGASDEFIELYNGTDASVDISGWKLKGSSSSGAIAVRLTINAVTILPAHRHFLAANSGGYSGSVLPDQSYTSGLVNDGGLALTLPNDTVIDQVGLSSGSAFREGMHLAPLPSDANQSYERKPGGMTGSTQDTSDNFEDFQLLTPSDPQNLASNPTPGPTPTPSPSPTSSPTPLPSPTPSASINPTPTVTPTPEPSPSPISSPTPASNPAAVISEFRTRGPNGANDEFIEIYNNSDFPLDISGWKLRGSSSSGSITTRLTVSAGTLIPRRGHFLATNSGGYSGIVTADQTYASGITNDGGLALTLPDDSVVDQVGLSPGSSYKEGMHLAPLPSDANQSYERKPGGSEGSTQDTNDNFSDFQLLTPSDPQNMNSGPTPGPSPIPSPSPSASPTPSPSPTTKLLVTQIFGGGGNSGAPFRNDFIEIFNSGQTAVNLAGWSIQYASATGTTWSVTPLTSILLAPGQHYLIQESSGGSGGVMLPEPDATGTIAMAAAAGKVALVRAATVLVGACPDDTSIVDLVGYGSAANCFRGAGPTPAPGNTTAVLRVSNGCADTQNNAIDFVAGSPSPTNSLSPLSPCSGANTGTLFITQYQKIWGELLPLLFDCSVLAARRSYWFLN